MERRSATELPKQSSSTVTEHKSISPLLKSLPNCVRRSIPPTAAPASRQLARGRVRDRQLKFFSAVFGPDSGKEN
jgi:hypothetical protein